jgi:hypothetical protein
MTVQFDKSTLVVSISSEVLLESGIDSVALKVKQGCSGTEHDYTPPDYSTGTFDVDLSSLLGINSDSHGVLSFTLVIEFDTSIVKQQYGCLFLEGDLVCQIVDCIKTNPNIDLQLDFYLLSRSNETDCGCECEDYCTIYKRLIDGIKNCKSC